MSRVKSKNPNGGWYDSNELINYTVYAEESIRFLMDNMNVDEETAEEWARFAFYDIHEQLLEQGVWLYSGRSKETFSK